MKEVWPNSGHTLTNLLGKLKTLNLDLEKSSQNDLLYDMKLMKMNC